MSTVCPVVVALLLVSIVGIDCVADNYRLRRKQNSQLHEMDKRAWQVQNAARAERRAAVGGSGSGSDSMREDSFSERGSSDSCNESESPVRHGSSAAVQYRRLLRRMGYPHIVCEWNSDGFAPGNSGSVRELEDVREWYWWQYIRGQEIDIRERKAPWKPWGRQKKHPDPVHVWRESIGLFREREQMMQRDSRCHNHIGQLLGADKSAVSTMHWQYWRLRRFKQTELEVLPCKQEQRRLQLVRAAANIEEAARDKAARVEAEEKAAEAEEKAAARKKVLEEGAARVKAEGETRAAALAAKKAAEEEEYAEQFRRISSILRTHNKPPDSMAGVQRKCKKSKSVRAAVLPGRPGKAWPDPTSEIENKLIEHHVVEHLRLFGVVPLRSESREFIRRNNIRYSFQHISKE